jgi:GT2 family glycosyltransferase
MARSTGWSERTMAVLARFSSRNAKTARRLTEEIEILHKSPLVDSVWYRQTYQDLRDTPIDVARHYLEHGAAEGRNPHPLFDTKFYVEQNSDVVASGMNPLLHYILHGGKDGRDPHPLFDVKTYLTNAQYLASSELDPLTHYITIGWKQGLRPHRRFDPNWYLKENSDVKELGLEPLTHYLHRGWKENRRPMPWFDPEAYRGRCNLSEEINPLVDYLLQQRRIALSVGALPRHEKPNLEASPKNLKSDFSGRADEIAWSAQSVPDSKADIGEIPIIKLIRESGAFDEAFYLAAHPDMVAADTDPLTHFVVHGWREGRNPCALFDTTWYLEENPDVRAARINPLEHYLINGVHEGRAPFPCFDTRWYLSQYFDLIPPGLAPVVHYMREGVAGGLDPCPYFHTLWYLYQYPDVKGANVNPLWHYVKHGASKGRDPSPFFDTDWYLDAYQDIRAAGINPLDHFLRTGEREGRRPQAKGSKLRGYDKWMATYESLDAASMKALADSVMGFRWRPRFSIVMPTYNTPDSILRAAVDSVLAQAYPDWELCIADDNSSKQNVRQTLQEYAAKDARITIIYRQTNGHIAEATNTAMALAGGDYICLMDHDDEIAPNALYEFAIKLNQDPALDFIYSDEDKLTEQGKRYEPFFKPDWSPEALEACMYTAHFACYRTSLVRKIGGFRKEFNGAQDYDFVLRFTEHARKVAHVPKILYHWRAIAGSTAASMENKDYVVDAGVRSLEERVKRTGELLWVRSNGYKGCFDVRRAIRGNPKVSIVIPSAGRDSEVRGKAVDLLVHCVDKIVHLSTYTNYEIIVVHNGDLRESTIAQLVGHQVVFIHYDEPLFNMPKKMNLGARHATGEYIMTFNDDIEVISPDWIEAMLSIGQNPEVGVVGAKLHFEDGKIQHVGVTFWEGLPDHIRRGFGRDDPGYFFSTVGQRNYLAVTGACALTRRSVFEAVGGYDETFRINYNDIDYCLKVYRAGFRIVYAAQAELYHYESRSRVREVSDMEIQLFLERWGDFVRDDPYYSHYFDAHPPRFELEGG